MFASSYLGGVNVAAGDLNQDGIPDVAVAPALGGPLSSLPPVRVLDGVSGIQIAGPLGSFAPFGGSYHGGIAVAVGDVNGDSKPDLIAAAVSGGTPEIRVFDGVSGALLADFFVTGSDFAGGLTIAAADLTGDGKAEIVVGAGAGGQPRVKVFNPLTGTTIAGPLGSFLAFASTFHGGVNVGSDAVAGDVNDDGTPDLAVGTGPGTLARQGVQRSNRRAPPRPHAVRFGARRR